jgi:cell wall-associated NlpC family hydrolase
MIISKDSHFLKFSILMLFAVMIVSCNTSSHTRSGKYSSNNKRQSRVYVSKERKSESKEITKRTDDKKEITVPSGLRNSIVEYALQYKGTKYRYGGKSPDTGFDCSGFTGFVFSQNGIPISGPSHDLARLGKPKTMDQLMPGDLVFFGDETRISHVGIVAKHSPNQIQIVHATTSVGVKVDEILGSEYWTTRFLYGRDLISK